LLKAKDAPGIALARAAAVRPRRPLQERRLRLLLWRRLRGRAAGCLAGHLDDTARHVLLWCPPLLLLLRLLLRWPPRLLLRLLQRPPCLLLLRLLLTAWRQRRRQRRLLLLSRRLLGRPARRRLRPAWLRQRRLRWSRGPIRCLRQMASTASSSADLDNGTHCGLTPPYR